MNIYHRHHGINEAYRGVLFLGFTHRPYVQFNSLLHHVKGHEVIYDMRFCITYSETKIRLHANVRLALKLAMM